MANKECKDLEAARTFMFKLQEVADTCVFFCYGLVLPTNGFFS